MFDRPSWRVRERLNDEQSQAMAEFVDYEDVLQTFIVGERDANEQTKELLDVESHEVTLDVDFLGVDTLCTACSHGE